MKDFNYYLEAIGEIGFVEEGRHSLIYASGLPHVHLNEIVIFETGVLGQVFSITKEQIEILLLSKGVISVGSKIARTNEFLRVSVGKGLLGRMVNPLGLPLDSKGKLTNVQSQSVDKPIPLLLERKEVEKPLETGVSIVDLVVPIGKGQRELVIGDRKTGKTEFLLQTIITQAKKGTICIYATIGQKQIDIKKLYQFFQEKKIIGNTLIIASYSTDPSGLIYLTPYSAMTAAEAFKDEGLDVLLILDDMTTHARTYREISLLGRRFPGRNSYPGDIFYIHARLIERAGNFKKGSITCLPVAESILGDLSGYLQTNLMAMTDGHIFFDIDLYNQGKRPAVNPFLSVTRVGHQTQSQLHKSTSLELTSFLVTYEKMKQFLHFGAEVGGTTKNVLLLGSLVDTFFNQEDENIPIQINLLVVASLWAGIWTETKIPDFKRQMEQLLLSYNTIDTFKNEIDKLILETPNFSDLVNKIRTNPELITSRIGRT